jgi:hypothetical protein
MDLVIKVTKPMITPELKDKVLGFLVSNCSNLYYTNDLESFSKEMDVSEPFIDSILEQFDERGFIEYERMLGGNFMLSIRAKAHDYYLMGGHLGEFRMLEHEFDKLHLEIINLEKQFGRDKFERIATTVQTLIAFFSAFYKK